MQSEVNSLPCTYLYHLGIVLNFIIKIIFSRQFYAPSAYPTRRGCLLSTGGSKLQKWLGLGIREKLLSESPYLAVPYWGRTYLICTEWIILDLSYKIIGPNCRTFQYHTVKGKAVPLQAWSGPEGSRKLRFPDFMTTAQDSGKIVSFTHRPPLPPGNAPGTHFCQRLSPPRAIVRSEGFYVNEKFQWHQLGSNKRPSDL